MQNAARLPAMMNSSFISHKPKSAPPPVSCFGCGVLWQQQKCTKTKCTPISMHFRQPKYLMTEAICCKQVESNKAGEWGEISEVDKI